MSRAAWSRVRSILEEALERNGAAREAFLADACAGDAELRAEIDDLLALERTAADLEPPAWSLHPALIRSAPQSIGPYSI